MALVFDTCFSSFWFHSLNLSLIRPFDFDFRNSALANALAIRGHNVTITSLDRSDKPPEGVHYIHFEGIYNERHQDLLKALFEMHSQMNPFTEPVRYDSLWYESCKGKELNIYNILNTIGVELIINK